MFGLIPLYQRRIPMQNREDDLYNLSRAFDNLISASVFPRYLPNSGYMKVDIREEDKAYILEAEMPGVTKEEVNIEIQDGQLTISVNRDENKDETEKNYVRRERRTFAMSRSFSLDNIDAGKISAKMENGLLALVLPKQEPVQLASRKVEIG